ncbi:MAG: YHYH domain-containing protein [Alphaproteobacteria bacterium]
MKKFVLAVIVSASLFSATAAVAHSGGTNAMGCHAGSQPYHCH